MKLFFDSLSCLRPVVFFSLVVSLGGVFQVSAETPEQQPDWWKDGNPPVITTATQNNKAAASIGQAKWMVKEALRALRAQGYTQLADEIETALATPPPVFDVNAIPDLANRDAAWYAKQKAPLQLGYLKALAKPFYDKLNALDPSWVLGQFAANNLTTAGTHYWTITGNPAYTEGGHYPWDPATPLNDNKGAATIGQVKVVFALRFETLPPAFVDADGDGLSDSYELLIGLNPNNSDENNNGVLDGLDDFDGDGVSNSAEMLAGTNAVDASDTPSGAPLEIAESSQTAVSNDLFVYTPVR